ncbi:hypothetical protein [Actinomadura luteofluorescens]
MARGTVSPLNALGRGEASDTWQELSDLCGVGGVSIAVSALQIRLLDRANLHLDRHHGHDEAEQGDRVAATAFSPGSTPSRGGYSVNGRM